jgi:FAD/FMN-containing dehydrogenase
MRTAMQIETITRFGQALRGSLVGREHPQYKKFRQLYNGAIDKHPLLIARCLDAADVVIAVNFGRDNGLPIAIRGGGHNGPGLASVDDGLVIDLSEMRGVRVDPETRTVRVAAGCVTGDVDHATHGFGLAVPFGLVSTTGVAGLTLSGGHGYLSRQYGLTADNLIEADVVLADGSFVTANETKNADLLWALRGGGGNFGVVTSFLFRAHPASTIFGGPLIWEMSDAAHIMRWYREFQSTAPDEFYVFLGLQVVPAGDPFPREHWSKRVCVLMAVHNGAPTDGERALQALRAGFEPRRVCWRLFCLSHAATAHSSAWA